MKIIHVKTAIGETKEYHRFPIWFPEIVKWAAATTTAVVVVIVAVVGLRHEHSCGMAQYKSNDW